MVLRFKSEALKHPACGAVYLRSSVEGATDSILGDLFSSVFPALRGATDADRPVSI